MRPTRFSKPQRPVAREAYRQARPQNEGPKRTSVIPHSDNTVYGAHSVKELIRASRRRIQELYITAGHDLIPFLEETRTRFEIVDRHTLEKMAPDAVHQNVLARTDPYPYVELREVMGKESVASPRLILALDCITDPQNFGALCRSALAFGVSGVIIPQDRSVHVTPVVCKASAGTVEHLHVARVVNLVRALEDCKKQGYWIYGAAAQATQDITTLDPAAKSVIVLGAEGSGLRRLVADTCDVLVKIPMCAVAESLNVAQAGTVLVFDFARKIRLL